MTCAKAFSVANNLGQTYGFHEAVNAELMLVAENIQQLRSWRISADYATARGFGQQQANDAYVAAEKLQVAARTLRTNSDRGYICMLAGMLLRKPERD